jgi:voltage-gated potassium channel
MTSHRPRFRQIFQRLSNLFFALALILLSFFIGIIGYAVIEKVSFIDAFFLTVIIISTVGMNEVGKISEAGKLFTAFFIVYNIMTVTYFVSVLTKYIFEGELKDIYRHYINKKNTYLMKNHTIVCGYGRYGRRICSELEKSDIPFVVIENSLEKIELLRQNISTNFVALHGNATEDEWLLEAGIQRAKSIICALPDDADNVFVTLTARELNPAIQIIAKASQETTVGRLYRAGANEVVLPDILGGLQMANLVIRPEVVAFINLLTGTPQQTNKPPLRLEELHYEQMQAAIQKKSIGELDIRSKTGVVVLGYKDAEGNFVLNPSVDKVFCPKETVIVLGTEQELQQFLNYCSVKS